MRKQFIAIAALAGMTSVSTAQVAYELVIIEPWNTTYSLATSHVGGLNNLNQVTGCATTEPLGGPCSFIWTQSTGKQSISLAGPINDLGVIVTTNTVRWPDGTFQTMDGDMSGAADLNNSNVIVGSDGSVFTCPVPPPYINREATVWSAATGTILLESQHSVLHADQAWAINNHNQIVGVTSSTGHCGDQKAFYYDLDMQVHIDLHTLLTGSSSGITHAVDINDAGVVIGDGPVTFGGGAFIWSAAAGFSFVPDLPSTEPGYSKPTSINNNNTVVGEAIVNGDWHAWIFDDQHGIRDLNDLVTLPSNFIVDRAEKINDNGWIIGSGHYGAWSPERAVVLIPIDACYADCDENAILNVFDYICFGNAYAAGCP
ncbi:MAG: hypothetical protein H6815_07120 [Phycisphaeraceae bacterium]|nr:hypothetical protein [Phycisphaerales bacterium]MCB9860211.1 hypothetical protein [Phycisphaeraceae bacterium]